MATFVHDAGRRMDETPDGLSDGLLATDEPPPFTVDNENGTSPLLIVADHAGKHFPRRLGQLGLSNAECERAALHHRSGAPFLVRNQQSDDVDQISDR